MCGMVPNELDGTKDGIKGSIAQRVTPLCSLMVLIEVSEWATGSICLSS